MHTYKHTYVDGKSEHGSKIGEAGSRSMMKVAIGWDGLAGCVDEPPDPARVDAENEAQKCDGKYTTVIRTTTASTPSSRQ